MAWRVGVDSGGTFTDVCLFEEDSGKFEVWKVSSTPDDPSRAIVQGVAEGMKSVDSDLSGIAYFGHGTTVGTNAVIQHTGARTGLITTEGFRDLLEIGRQKRPDLYDMQADKPPVIVARDLRLGVPERVRADGTIEITLDEQAVREAALQLKAAGVKAVAVSFLYGFIHPAHENRALEIISEVFPEAFVSSGNGVAPEFREYERLSTAVLNAYLGPVMQGYIRRLAKRLAELGMSATPHLTQSNGGVIGFEQAARLPVRTVLSGPSTGVVAAQQIGRMIGIPDLITFDMGGTSTDVALLKNGVCGLTGEAMVHGYPIKAPMLDIHTVGAGGGSTAYIDNGGLLKVGPRSCGAYPGPVCYGQGNTEPSTTDANVVLQTLNPQYLLGGRMKIDQQKARDAIARMANDLGMGVYETAQGIVSVVTANMAKAIRVISVQRGHDPRDYSLFACGGAGPLHAARLARELEIRRIVVPRNPGTLCALGLLMTDLRADFSATRLAYLKPESIGTIEDVFRDLVEQAEAWFAEEGVPVEDQRMARTVDMRYKGQNYELSVALPEGPVAEDTLEALAERFAEAHHQKFGFVAEGEMTQLVTYRLEALGIVRKARVEPQPDGGPDASPAIIGSREVWMPEAGDFVSCPLYDRDRLKAGNVIEGPAIVEQMDTTTVILRGMTARVEPHLNLILEFGE